MQKVLSLWDRKGAIIVIISAMTPLPYVPLIFGALGLRRKAFLFYGMIPRAITILLLGIMLKLGISFL